MDALWILAVGMLVVVAGILGLRLHAFLALLLGAWLVGILTPPQAIIQHALSKKLSLEEARAAAQMPVPARMAREFGNTAGRLGILIALASIIGKCLLESGGAERIVRTWLNIFGEGNAALVLLVSSFILAMPIFFDMVFLLLIPIGKALRLRTGANYTLYVLSLIAGGSMTHSLVPPTPGPLFVATELKVNLGLMIAAGLVVGAGTVSCGWLFARWVNRHRDIPVRETAPGSLGQLKELAERSENELPPFWLAATPIALPVILIGARALVSPGFALAPQSALKALLLSLGEPNVALALAAVIGLVTLWRQGQERNQVFSAAVGRALEQAGAIILIVSAGGAFGAMLQQTGIGVRLQELSSNWHIGALPLAWAFTALIRIAQGSTTVAMITAAGVFGGPAATASALGFHPVWLALAIGCGSKPIPWMNDSGFWVISRTSGFTEKECLTTYSPMVTLMGIVGLFIVMVLAKLFPLA
jgi:GntP family gluconate:H+ symporter